MDEQTRVAPVTNSPADTTAATFCAENRGGVLGAAVWGPEGPGQEGGCRLGGLGHSHRQEVAGWIPYPLAPPLRLSAAEAAILTYPAVFQLTLPLQLSRLITASLPDNLVSGDNCYLSLQIGKLRLSQVR